MKAAPVTFVRVKTTMPYYETDNLTAYYRAFFEETWDGFGEEEKEMKEMMVYAVESKDDLEAWFDGWLPLEEITGLQDNMIKAMKNSIDWEDLRADCRKYVEDNT